MAKQKPARKNILSKKHETRNRWILYISAISIGLPLLFANVYLQTQSSDGVLGISTRAVPTGVQNQGDGSQFQNKLTCEMCVKAVHGDGIIVLQHQSQNSKEWGAICLPKAALNATPTPRPFPTPTPKLSSIPTPRPSVTPTPRPTFIPTPTPALFSLQTSTLKNYPYILCPQPTSKPTPTGIRTPTPHIGFTTRISPRPTPTTPSR